MSDRVEVYAGPKVIGFVESGVFRKNVRSSKHFLKKPPAIAMDVASLEMAEAAGAVAVEVTDLDTGIVYTVSVRKVWQQGWLINRGHGDQVALSLSFWDQVQLELE